MQLNGLIFTLPKEIRLLIGAFVIILSIGFLQGYCLLVKIHLQIQMA